MAWELVLYDGCMEHLPHRYAWTKAGAWRKADRILRKHRSRTAQGFVVR